MLQSRRLQQEIITHNTGLMGRESQVEAWAMPPIPAGCIKPGEFILPMIPPFLLEEPSIIIYSF
jgi:hypothetical protein